MNEPLLDLTIIVANYNTRELLRSCLESVYQFTEGIRFEVICVDDNSPDDSADMVAALFPQVIFVRNGERLLYARNHNIGMKMSRARYACHLDSDTLLSEQRACRLGLLHGRESRGCSMRPQTVKRRRIGATLHSKLHRRRDLPATGLELAQNVSSQPRDEPLLQYRF